MPDELFTGHFIDDIRVKYSDPESEDAMFDIKSIGVRMYVVIDSTVMFHYHILHCGFEQWAIRLSYDCTSIDRVHSNKTMHYGKLDDCISHTTSNLPCGPRLPNGWYEFAEIPDAYSSLYYIRDGAVMRAMRLMLDTESGIVQNTHAKGTDKFDGCEHIGLQCIELETFFSWKESPKGFKYSPTPFDILHAGQFAGMFRTVSVENEQDAKDKMVVEMERLIGSSMPMGTGLESSR